MYKTIAFIVATLLVAHAIAPITDCVVESGATPPLCYVCKLGKAPASGGATCVDVTGDCQIPALADINGLKLCDLCKDGKKPTATGTCVANTSAITLGDKCGLAYASATAWTCVGCSGLAATGSAFVKIMDANCVEVNYTANAVNAVEAALVTGLTSKTCPVNYKNLGTDADKCADYKALGDRINETTSGNHIQYFDMNGNSTGGILAYYSSDKTVDTAGAITTTAIADCWIANSAAPTECLKCRWGKLTTYQPTATGVKVTCAAADATVASATVAKCVAKIIPTVAGVAADTKCHLCAYLNGTLAAVNSTFFCPDGAVAGGNNSSNNTSNPTTSSSILSLSFAAFLILIINRLF